MGGRATLGLYLYDGADDDQDYDVAREVIDIGKGVNNKEVSLRVDTKAVQSMAAHMSEPEYHIHLDEDESTLVDVTPGGLVFDVSAGDIVVSLLVNCAPAIVNATSFAGPIKHGCNLRTRPSPCATRPYDMTNNLAHPSNGALPAVAKDAIPYDLNIRKPSFANDGTYGNGGSWISNSAWSWLKVDLGGCGRVVDSIKFGRDRLYGYDDRDPGQVRIYVADSENMYANRDESMDSSEYTLVYSSEGTGFIGLIEKDATLKASFPPVNARFVKVEVENSGACIDEIEVIGTVRSDCG